MIIKELLQYIHIFNKYGRISCGRLYEGKRGKPQPANHGLKPAYLHAHYAPHGSHGSWILA